jgi:uncharacterized protein
MTSSKEIIDYLRAKKPYYFKSFGLTKLGLIGSFARGQQTKRSDIDLIVEFQPGTENLYEIKEKLKKSMKRKFKADVDICTEKYLKPYYRNNILKDAIFI